MVDSSWSLASLGLVTAALAWGFIWYERRGSSTREIALVATLAALAGLSRIPFAAFPSVQPTTFLVLISGFVFGPGPGFITGSMAAFASNMLLGQGPWTPWQMAAWGLAGICGGLLGRKNRPFRKPLMVFVALGWGFLFGWILNTWHWLAFIYPLNLNSFLVTQLSGIWADTMHALANGLFMLLAGKELIRLLDRFKSRLRVEEI